MVNHGSGGRAPRNVNPINMPELEQHNGTGPPTVLARGRLSTAGSVSARCKVLGLTVTASKIGDKAMRESRLTNRARQAPPPTSKIDAGL